MLQYHTVPVPLSYPRTNVSCFQGAGWDSHVQPQSILPGWYRCFYPDCCLSSASPVLAPVLCGFLHASSDCLGQCIASDILKPHNDKASENRGMFEHNLSSFYLLGLCVSARVWLCQRSLRRLWCIGTYTGMASRQCGCGCGFSSFPGEQNFVGNYRAAKLHSFIINISYHLCDSSTTMHA